MPGLSCKAILTIVSNSFIYLASQSPRRQELLKQIGVRFEMLDPDASEDSESIEIPLPNEKARVYVERVTTAKSKAALARWPTRQSVYPIVQMVKF